MAFALVTDTSANLPAAYLQQHDVQAIPYAYYIDDVEHFCPGPDEFDGAAYYQMLTDGGVVKTTLINAQRYEDFFRPYLEAGQDLLYVGMSSGISSSLNMATLAAHDLLEEFPERKLVVFDAMTASLGEGIFVRAAIRRRDAGMSLGETAAQLINLRSRKKALRAIADECIDRMLDDPDQCVSIAHGGCEEEARYVADLIREGRPGTEIELEVYEPVTGSYVGPGTVALFFVGRKQ